MISRDPFRWLGLICEVALFVFAAGSGAVIWVRRRSARHWPIAFGKIESASSYQNVSQWLTDVSYSYSIEGGYYSGQFQLTSRTERKANEHESRWKGRNISVRYSPRNKDISVVRIEDQASVGADEFRG